MSRSIRIGGEQELYEDLGLSPSSSEMSQVYGAKQFIADYRIECDNETKVIKLYSASRGKYLIEVVTGEDSVYIQVAIERFNSLIEQYNTYRITAEQLIQGLYGDEEL